MNAFCTHEILYVAAAFVQLFEPTKMVRNEMAAS